MAIKNLIVFGSTSSIARTTIPYLEFERGQIFSFDRMKSKPVSDPHIPAKNQYQVDFDRVEAIELSIIGKLGKLIDSPCVILNFMGVFGEVQPIDTLDISGVLSTNYENLLPFLIIAKIANKFPPGSSVISFSGAGIGGGNLDDSSMGYLSAKGSMAILAEVIDRQLSSSGIRFGLVAPGAFPSPMQDIVARESELKIPASRILKAREVMGSNPTPDKLIHLLNFLIKDPDAMGGRTWSANYDELTQQKKDFGKLRRIF